MEGREVRLCPPMMVVARGYGMAASELANLARVILESRGLTPKRIVICFRCNDWVAPIEAALRGEVHEDVKLYQVRRLARALIMTEDEWEGLIRAFRAAGADF